MEPTNQPEIVNVQSSGEHKKVGPIIAALVIVLVLVIAALYIFASRSGNEPVNTQPQTNTQTQNDGLVKPINSTSDDPASLQADLEASIEGLEDQNF